jgi:hypothetical protein
MVDYTEYILPLLFYHIHSIYIFEKRGESSYFLVGIQTMADYELLRLSTAKFWVLLVVSISSAFCTLLIFVYFYRQRKRLSLHQHRTFVLVTLSFIQMATDFPFQMIYYYYGVVIPSSDTFCLWWNWLDYSISGAPVFATAWGYVNDIY